MTTTPTESAEPTADAANIATIAAGVLGLALSVAAFAIYGSRTGLSVALGAVIAVANLLAMRAIVRALLRGAEAEAEEQARAEEAKAQAAETPATGAGTVDPEADVEPPRDHAAEGKRGGAAWGGFALVKILILFGGIWILLTRGMVDPIPLVVGYGVLPLGIAASSLFTGLAPRSRRPRRSGSPSNKSGRS